jgi:hypothetical protein
MEIAGAWVLLYDKPGQADCIAGPFETQADAERYAESLPADRTNKRIEYGTMVITPKRHPDA